jgi:gas vesicle protein
MGTVIGILTAPEAGRITRKKIRDEADKFVDKAMAKKRMKEMEKPQEADVVVVEERYAI